MSYNAQQARVPAGDPAGGQWLGGNVSRQRFEQMSARDKMNHVRSGGDISNDPMRPLFDRLAQPDGGFTYQPLTGDEPHEGFAVSIYPERSVAIRADKFTFDHLAKYAYHNVDLLTDSRNHLGTWHDPDSHKIFLDVSIVAKSAGDAARLCREHDQKAYFDLKAGRSVEVDKSATSGGVA